MKADAYRMEPVAIGSMPKRRNILLCIGNAAAMLTAPQARKLASVLLVEAEAIKAKEETRIRNQPPDARVA